MLKIFIKNRGHIKVKMSIGEVLDKYSILQIKYRKIANKQKLLNVETELKYLDKLIKHLFDSYIEDYIKLYEINLKLWDVEDYLRLCEKTKTFDDKFIQAARSVYIFNDQRAKIKKEINEKSNSKFVEEKEHINYG